MKNSGCPKRGIHLIFLRHPRTCSLLILLLLGVALAPTFAQNAAPVDIVAELQGRLDRGDTTLEYANDGSGYLRSVLAAFSVPVDSQLLVFSRTSLQADLINPQAPRAIFFRSDISVGSVQHGKVLEFITTDNDGQLAFYTLDTMQV